MFSLIKAMKSKQYWLSSMITVLALAFSIGVRGEDSASISISKKLIEVSYEDKLTVYSHLRTGKNLMAAIKLSSKGAILLLHFVTGSLMAGGNNTTVNALSLRKTTIKMERQMESS